MPAGLMVKILKFVPPPIKQGISKPFYLVT